MGIDAALIILVVRSTLTIYSVPSYNLNKSDFSLDTAYAYIVG